MEHSAEEIKADLLAALAWIELLRCGPETHDSCAGEFARETWRRYWSGADGDIAYLPKRSGESPAPSGTVGADGRLVASFRLPVAVKGLIFLSDWLRKQYGEGLTMRQQGEFLFIERPNGQAHRAATGELPMK